MTTASFILGFLLAVSAVAAITLRNLVHCALALAVSLAALAGLYLDLNAQFVGFAQFLVYVGAVAILIVFAILLTRGGEPGNTGLFAKGWAWGLAAALGIFGIMAGAFLGSSAFKSSSVPAAEPGVRELGEQLMTRYLLPLEVLGLLLTAALIGAVVLAMRDRTEE